MPERPSINSLLKRARPDDDEVMLVSQRATSGPSPTKASSSTFGNAYFQLRSPLNHKRAKGSASASAHKEPRVVASSPARNRNSRTASDEPRARDQREPKSNREILYGLLPAPGGGDNGIAFSKRSKGAKSRRLHSKIDETTGETQRLTPCVHCAFQLVNWEGPEEGPRPLCVNRASGAQGCSRCFANKKGCVDVPATALEKVKAMEEEAQRTSTDDDLPALHKTQMAAHTALRRAVEAAKARAADETEPAKKKKERDEERRLKAVEKQAEAAMEQAKASMEIAKAIVRHGEIMERSIALLQPQVVNSALAHGGFEDDEDDDDRWVSSD